MADDTKVCPNLHLKDPDTTESQEADRLNRHMYKKTPAGEAKSPDDNKFSFWLGPYFLFFFKKIASKII